MPIRVSLITGRRPTVASFPFPYHDPQDFLTIKTTFRLNPAVAELLEGARPKNHAEMDAKIAGWQASSETSYSYHNFTCSRPDRLWLVIPFTLQKAGAVEFSRRLLPQGQLSTARMWATCSKMDANGNSFYVDITELVCYGPDRDPDNTIELSIRNLGKNEFMGPFLLYPGEAPTEAVASEARRCQPARCLHAVR